MRPEVLYRTSGRISFVAALMAPFCGGQCCSFITGVCANLPDRVFPVLLCTKFLQL